MTCFRGRLLIEGKNAPREVYISAQAKAVATRLVADADTREHIVPSAKNTERTRANVVSQVFARWKERLGIDLRGAAHAMRHSFATAAVRGGVAMLDLQAAGGWSTPRMVARYYHAGEDRLRGVADAVAGAGMAEAGKTGTDR